jgi:multidrug transporter EmrE-like cation transporter
MAWIYLFPRRLFEIRGAVGLKYTVGFTASGPRRTGGPWS